MTWLRAEWAFVRIHWLRIVIAAIGMLLWSVAFLADMRVGFGVTIGLVIWSAAVLTTPRRQ